MSRPVRTRFAPSPTGPLHIGGVRTALYAYLFAKKHKGSFLLRIEDTDTARTVPGSEDLINKTLAWCGITPDEGVHEGGNFGPYKQSERKEIYIKYAHELVANGKAYYAFDTEEEIASWREKTASENNGNAAFYGFATRMQLRNSLSLSEQDVKQLLDQKTPFVVRLKVEPEDTVVFNDIIRGQVKFEANQLDDRVLLKSDGMPTYHLANVVDDYLMQITHVIRGEEWLASTPHHVLLYRGFGWEAKMPVFAHLPLLLKPDGKGKLSKRDGDRLGFPVFALEWMNPETQEKSIGYKERGFLPQAFVNFLALLGWNDGSDQEIFSMDALIDSFSLERVQKAGAKFNFEKATWFNQQYIQKLDISYLSDLFNTFLKEKGIHKDTAFVNQYCALFRERITFLHELNTVGSYLYQDITFYDTETYQKKYKPEVEIFKEQFIEALLKIESLDAAKIEILFKSLLEQLQMKIGEVMPIFRILLTGIMQGPPVFDTINLLGAEESIARLKKQI
jgi:glutamyl-tRNA synthetase